MKKSVSPTNFVDTWQLMRDAFLFLSDHKILNIFPLISLILLCSLFAGTLAFVPFSWTSIDYFFAAFLYFLVIFLVNFNNFALTTIVVKRLRNQPISILDAAKNALVNSHRIIFYTLIVGIFSIPGKLIEGLQNGIQRTTGYSFAYNWSTATFFLLPIMAIKNVGPISAMQQSASTIGRGWRSTIQVKTFLAIFFIFFLLMVSEFLPYYPMQMTHILIASLPIFLIAVLLTNTLEVIVNSAIYLRLTQFQALKNFDQTILHRAFINEND